MMINKYTSILCEEEEQVSLSMQINIPEKRNIRQSQRVEYRQMPAKSSSFNAFHPSIASNFIPKSVSLSLFDFIGSMELKQLLTAHQKVDQLREKREIIQSRSD
jgi:hypothetical protein